MVSEHREVAVDLAAPRVHTLAQFTQLWRHSLSAHHQLGPTADFPLNISGLIDRSSSASDLQTLPWRELLAADIEHGPILSFQKSENAYREHALAHDVTIFGTWDVDSFLSRVTTLAVH